jgi:GAF domain-containing protein
MENRPNLEARESNPADLTTPRVATHQSPEEMAQRDLDAALQLLAGRAQSTTGASAVAIALFEGEQLACRASSGRMPEGSDAHLPLNYSIVKESIRVQQIVCCRDTENTARDDRESCRALGIKSIMVLPLIREDRVIGVFELLADKVGVFDDRQGAELERLSEMVLTALEHADAAKRALSEIATKTDPAVAAGVASSDSASPAQVARLGACESCGLPVSEGRALCVTCEEARSWEESSGPGPSLLSRLEQERARSWLQSHLYTIATLLIVVLTVLLLWLKLR